MASHTSFSIAIATYKRPGPLGTLLADLDRQARANPEEWEGVEIVVVVDGDDAGYGKALAEVDPTVRLVFDVQPHSGLSTARNRGLELASGELVYFLDDDLIPADGTVALHRRSHGADDRHLVLGPCLLPEGLRGAYGVREWWEAKHQRLSMSGRIEKFDDFSIANSSGPRSVLIESGGFNTDFRGYGFEDYELGVRLKKLGVEELYEPAAVAWHHTEVDDATRTTRSREEARNAVRLVRLHPEVAETYFPVAYPGPHPWLLDIMAIRRPGPLAAISRMSALMARHCGRISDKLEEHLDAMAIWSSHAAGIAEMDRNLLPRALGRPASGRPWTWRPRSA